MPSIPNSVCLRKACDRLGIRYTTHDRHNNLITVHLPTGDSIFANSASPFNSDAVIKICFDKEFMYLLLKDSIQMPKTVGFFDPYQNHALYKQFASTASHQTIAKEILATFQLPVIVKMNAGHEGRNVFLCESPADITNALKTIYNRKSLNYDSVALAQEFIDQKREFRVIVFRGKIVLLYAKDFSRISPQMTRKIARFIKPIFKKVPLEFGGLDIIEDAHKNLYLIEMNSRPGFFGFISKRGEEPLIRMYAQILRQISKK
jgi:glutathione synthase/RimK-type ligase-like ATP-grasp enzyme